MGAVGPVQRLADDMQHPIDVGHHVWIGDMQHGEAQPVQVGIASFVTRRIGVRVAVDFHDQSGRRTEEVGNRSTDHLLTAELEAAELSIREMSPEALFRLSRIVAHGAGAFVEFGELFN